VDSLGELRPRPFVGRSQVRAHGVGYGDTFLKTFLAARLRLLIDAPSMADCKLAVGGLRADSAAYPMGGGEGGDVWMTGPGTAVTGGRRPGGGAGGGLGQVWPAGTVLPSGHGCGGVGQVWSAGTVLPSGHGLTGGVGHLWPRGTLPPSVQGLTGGGGGRYEGGTVGAVDGGGGGDGVGAGVGGSG
jgi:hypothetical protein